MSKGSKRNRANGDWWGVETVAKWWKEEKKTRIERNASVWNCRTSANIQQWRITLYRLHLGTMHSLHSNPIFLRLNLFCDTMEQRKSHACCVGISKRFISLGETQAQPSPTKPLHIATHMEPITMYVVCTRAYFPHLFITSNFASFAWPTSNAIVSNLHNLMHLNGNFIYATVKNLIAIKLNIELNRCRMGALV